MTPPSPSSAPAPGLTADQKRQWDRDGYLILPDALAPTQVADLLAATHQLLADLDLRTHPMTRFSTGESAPHVGDAYFLESGDQIRFFFEPDAFSPGGALLRRPDAAINKIGHGLHRRHPGFRAATLTARHAAIARDLGFRDPRVLQSMVVCKQPQLGARVPPHQDSTFLYTDPPSAVGFWYALQDCAPDNGCLSFAPGSHARVPVARRFVRNADGGGTAFVANEGSRWPEGLEPPPPPLMSDGGWVYGERVRIVKIGHAASPDGPHQSRERMIPSQTDKHMSHSCSMDPWAIFAYETALAVPDHGRAQC